MSLRWGKKTVGDTKSDVHDYLDGPSDHDYLDDPSDRDERMSDLEGWESVSVSDWSGRGEVWMKVTVERNDGDASLGVYVVSSPRR